MKERGILMSAPMVRALIDGSKAQTRRAVKIKGLQFEGSGGKGDPDWNDPACWGFEDANTGHDWALGPGPGTDHVFPCPYGQPGDRLWVRESWRTDVTFNRTKPSEIPRGSRILYDADFQYNYLGGKGRPSIFMPRWASRILLEITDVRVERLQDISESDAIAEGIKRIRDGFERFHPCPTDTKYEGLTRDPVLAYRGLLESINGAGSWDANPWVWVIEFKRVTP